ncbi:phosphotransferase system lactose/cellobiose-specific iia subunit [Lucifera butyrica]|uniref:Phosphotransferase system lactose/cellobiose-specific iia subunit n=1 Tax=Lucifera butyrica TaxID=1351585 RepID=A0A498R7T5_9FIRM|nr:PTS lactose/cellobiose transporter subunit IIA [Lucifera butyrica]VBB06990.1 phosphotransferase system lactose/cellobiose-specific iia subunit [Lucifera butyrica]
MELEQVVFQIILHAGDARNYAMEALRLARGKNFTAAGELMEKAKVELNKAHHVQTNLLQEEAGGKKPEVSLLLIHAQDHLMTTIVAKDLIEELILMLQER